MLNTEQYSSITKILYCGKVNAWKAWKVNDKFRVIKGQISDSVLLLTSVVLFSAQVTQSWQMSRGGKAGHHKPGCTVRQHDEKPPHIFVSGRFFFVDSRLPKQPGTRWANGLHLIWLNGWGGGRGLPRTHFIVTPYGHNPGLREGKAGTHASFWSRRGLKRQDIYTKLHNGCVNKSVTACHAINNRLAHLNADGSLRAKLCVLNKQERDPSLRRNAIFLIRKS